MSIPVSNIVTVNPGVIGGGGVPLSLNGLIVSDNEAIPANGGLTFASDTAVKDFFGSDSDEYAWSQTYFNGFNNSTVKPNAILFSKYNAADQSAWLRSGSFAGVALTTIQGFTGVLTITDVDGASFTSATINLSGASSFTNAATLITAGFSGAGKPTCAWDAVGSRFVMSSPTAGASSSLTYATGTLSANLKLTLATGALLSQGMDEDTPTTAMDRIALLTQNWVSFTTSFEPDTDTKELFADWAQDQNLRYLYVAWDTDTNAIVNGNTTCFGYLAKSAAYDCVACISGDTAAATAQDLTLEEVVRDTAIFLLGAIGSINFQQTNGRITAAFKSQGGLPVGVYDETASDNLLANGYSFYGQYNEVNNLFNFLYNGQMPGDWKWVDTFVDQVYMNSQFRLALITLLTSITSDPYTQAGYNLIRAAMQDPINQMLNFGGIRAGVVLSESQKAQVNTAAGRDVAGTIEQTGYYLQILDPGAQARAARETPIINFWYTDGGSIQNITLASIDIL